MYIVEEEGQPSGLHLHPGVQSTKECFATSFYQQLPLL